MQNGKFKEFLSEVCEDCCSEGTYCTLKEFLISSRPDPRMLAQLKCIEKFKFEKSKEIGEDIGWQKAHLLWVDEGYAKKFAEIYKEDMHIKEMYNKIRTE